MLYLASPYTGTEEQMRDRYEQALRVTATLLHNKIWVYSPIVHCHEMSVRYGMPRDADFWSEYDHVSISNSSGVCVLLLPGWENSKGVHAEVALAEELGKEISLAAIAGEKLFMGFCREQANVFPLIR